MAGYTTITVNGQEIGLRFGLPAIKRISDKINLLAGQEEITINLMAMVHIIYAGYLNDRLATDNEPKHDFTYFYDFVEKSAIENSMDDIKKAVGVFADSKEVSVKKDTGEEKKSKSQSIGKKWKGSVSARTENFVA